MAQVSYRSVILDRILFSLFLLSQAEVEKIRLLFAHFVIGRLENVHILLKKAFFEQNIRKILLSNAQNEYNVVVMNRRLFTLWMNFRNSRLARLSMN